MSTAEWVSAGVAALSIVTGATVAILVPLASARREDERAERQINAARLDELRGVLEAAGLTLTEACDAVLAVQIYASVSTIERGEFAKRARELTRLIEPLTQHIQRILIRVGPDNHLAIGFREAFAAVGAASATAEILASDFDDAEDVAQRSTEIVSFHRQARRHTDAFYRAAAEAVGPKVREAPILPVADGDASEVVSDPTRLGA